MGQGTGLVVLAGYGDSAGDGLAGNFPAFYAAIALCLSLLPWNCSEPLTGQRAWRTFFSAPVAGNVAAVRQPQA
jgi:hypothetical protein